LFPLTHRPALLETINGPTKSSLLYSGSKKLAHLATLTLMMTRALLSHVGTLTPTVTTTSSIPSLSALATPPETLRMIQWVLPELIFQEAISLVTTPPMPVLLWTALRSATASARAMAGPLPMMDMGVLMTESRVG